jgi:hypothetical protein
MHARTHATPIPTFHTTDRQDLIGIVSPAFAGATWGGGGVAPTAGQASRATFRHVERAHETEKLQKCRPGV